MSAAADLVPQESAPWATFARMRDEGVIPYQFCSDCQRSVFYPRVLCPHCGSLALRWQRSAGLGSLYSHTFVPNREGGGHSVLLVDLDEGFRLMASAHDEAETLSIGMRMRGSVVWESGESEPRFVFQREDRS